MTLTLDAISIATGAALAVEDVSLDLPRGEVVALVGESGAGKSLLGAAAIGLLPEGARLAGGSIRLDGVSIEGFDEAGWARLRGRRIGAVFQDPQASLHPLMKVRAQLEETLAVAGRPRGRAVAAAWLEAVGIADPEARLSAYPHQLSGGMRQRVALALALCAEPDVLVADEPTTALDVVVQAQIVVLLRRLAAERGTGVLLITHDFGVVAMAADRVGVMYAGRLVEVGPVASVLRRPRHPYTAALLRGLPSLARPDAALRPIEGRMPAPDARPPGCAFAPRCERADGRCRDAVPALSAGVACLHPLS